MSVTWSGGTGPASGDRISGDRRSRGRLAWDTAVRYRSRKRSGPAQEGAGRLKNLSSGGVSFVAEEALPVGADIEVSMDWPVKLDGVHPLTLRLFGNVVRCEGNTVAAQITREEFARTMPVKSETRWIRIGGKAYCRTTVSAVAMPWEP